MQGFLTSSPTTARTQHKRKTPGEPNSDPISPAAAAATAHTNSEPSSKRIKTTSVPVSPTNTSSKTEKSVPVDMPLSSLPQQIFTLLTTYINQLKQLFNFTDDQLARIVNHRAGYDNLIATHAFRQILREMQFTPEQIVTIVGYEEGWQNLAAIISHRQILQALAFTREQIVALVGRAKGWESLTHLKILREMQFTREQIVAIFDHEQGWRNLAAIFIYRQMLQDSGLTREQIVILVGRERGWESLNDLNQFKINLLTHLTVLSHSLANSSVQIRVKHMLLHTINVVADEKTGQPVPQPLAATAAEVMAQSKRIFNESQQMLIAVNAANATAAAVPLASAYAEHALLRSPGPASAASVLTTDSSNSNTNSNSNSTTTSFTH
jgi:hypothetical protein